jgi:LCP family protein required for cell wall assembly
VRFRAGNTVYEMNGRRFYFVFTFFISIFLFITGVFLLQTYDLSSSSFVFAEQNPDNEQPSASDPEPGQQQPDTEKEPSLINVLLLVGDRWGDNTDTIIAASYNTNTDKLNLISIPRDTYVDNANMEVPKINALYRRNKELLLKKTEEILGLEIEHYVYINIETFRDIIDLLGGVDIYIPADLDYDDPTQDLHIHFRKGLHHLDGRRAELYLRFRKPNNSEFSEELLKYYDGSDLKRIEAQKNFIKELVRQKANLFYLTKLNQIISTVYDNTETNIPMGEALNMIKHAVGFDPKNLNTFSLPGSIAIIEEFDCFVPDPDQVKEIIDNEINSY